jgi:hypothetical protein
MRKALTAITMFIGFAAFAQEQDLAFLYISKIYNDTIYHSSNSSASRIINKNFADFDLSTLLANKQPARNILGYSAKNKPVEAYYFPGTSAKKALVIGGVHGSELSAVEVANRLVEKLGAGQKPYYNVIIIPVLFPDNATNAETFTRDRISNNVGRYTNEDAIDPNRQLPALGEPFYTDMATDAYGRPIEKENALLLQLIQAYEPERIVSLHAIKDQSKAGVYADPRTDCDGRALGYSSDSTLAVLMAKYIDENKGNAFGNKIKTAPTALYYLDPKAAPPGELQPRNLMGMNMSGKINGVSLGSWASTAVCDEETNYRRDAIRMFTIEFPGYKKPSEYKLRDDREWYGKQVDLYSSAIRNYFLQDYFVEEKASSASSMVLR